MYRIPSTLDSDLDYTESLIRKFQAGEISAAELKSNRVPLGIYEQRKDRHHMLRVRCAGGLITPNQLAQIAFVGHQVSASHLHLTTRQEIQIHNVDIADAIPALRKLEKAGLSTAGGGGNTVRNMTVDDRSGLTGDEEFDVYPYVEELTSRLIAEKDSFTMPRKYKVAIDYNVKDAHSSYVADFGLQARTQNGKRGFRVLIAGSTSTNPHTGWEVFAFLPEIDLMRAAKALKNWFNMYGNRRNRHKARMRYIFYKYGEEEAKKFYYEEFKKLKQDASLDFFAPPLPLEHHRPSFAPSTDNSQVFKTWKKRYAHKQTTREGLAQNLWYTYIPVDHGNNRTEFFASVAEFMDKFGNDVIRFTKKEQIQIRNINEEYLPDIYHFFKKIGDYQIDYPVIINNLISCTGADTCRLGICLPKGAIDATARHLLASNLNLDAIPDFELRMNGCTNICANATWADLGFSGRIGRMGDDPFPAYTVWLPAKGRNQIDLQQGYVPARHIPGFVEDYLRDVIAHQCEYTDYYDYVANRGVETVKQLTEKYIKVKPFNEEPQTYYDWGDDEKFSLVKYGQAECSAGLFDIIELDQQTIAEKRKEIESGTVKDIEKTLHDIVFAENRMLLVTRGIDPRTDDDVYNGFTREFIQAGIVPVKYQILTDKARHDQSLAEEQTLIFELSDLLDDLYRNMSDNLQFNTEKVKETAVPESSKIAAEEKTVPEEKSGNVSEPDVKKDFRGVACPMNFVKTKIALAPMKSGQILEILLDDGQPIQNVPGSVKNEGHTVLSTEKTDNYWKVIIKKK